MASPGQLAGQEAVAGHEAGQEGEAVEAGVAAGVEDEHGGNQDEVVQGVTEEAGAEDLPDHLGDHGGRTELVRHGVGPAGQQCHPEDPEGQDRAHDHQGLAGVDRFGTPETGDAVGDGFEARERRTAVGEGAQQHYEGHPHKETVARHAQVTPVDLMRGGKWDVVQEAQAFFDQPDDDDRGQREDEEVGGDGEEPPGLADAPEVPVQEDQHHSDRDGNGEIAHG